MRVLSLVPSLTETLAVCGVNLVGRTRFCIHPAESLTDLPVVGGTKDLSWDKVKSLNPDLLILDREENLPWMRDEAPCAVHVFHASELATMAEELHRLNQALGGLSLLAEMASEYGQIAQREPLQWDWARLPGQMETWGGPPKDIHTLDYVIWKNPWMKVGPGTYIYSVLQQLGAGPWLASGSEKYPQFNLEADVKSGSFFLFSSEPFPFQREVEKFRTAQIPGALVDGESYSWFGVRSLRFLQSEYERIRFA